jgi:hypothetical protein
MKLCDFQYHSRVSASLCRWICPSKLYIYIYIYIYAYHLSHVRTTCPTNCLNLMYRTFSLLHTWWVQYHHRGLFDASQGTVPEPDQLGASVRGEVHRAAGGVLVQPSPRRVSRRPASYWLQCGGPHRGASCQLSQQGETGEDHGWGSSSCLLEFVPVHLVMS